VARIAHVTGMLQPVVLLDRGGVDQVHGKACIPKTVDQPVPVVGRLHRYSLQFPGTGLQRRDNRGELIGQALLMHHAVVFIEHHDHTVVGMQIDTRVQFHLSVSSSVDTSFSLPMQTIAPIDLEADAAG
jgi:hypothetical protein